jgi:hypothetical protein
MCYIGQHFHLWFLNNFNPLWHQSWLGLASKAAKFFQRTGDTLLVFCMLMYLTCILVLRACIQHARANKNTYIYEKVHTKWRFKFHVLILFHPMWPLMWSARSQFSLCWRIFKDQSKRGKIHKTSNYYTFVVILCEDDFCLCFCYRISY